VVAHFAADYRGLVAGLEQGLIQIAWVPPIAAARAMQGGNIRPAVVAIRNGTTSYAGCLFSLASSKVRELSDLRSVSAAWVDRESASGYGVVRSLLKDLGLSLVDAFEHETFERSHADVARAVATGKADVGATFLSFRSGTREVDRAGWREGGLRDDEVQIVFDTGPIPADLFAVHSRVGDHQVKALQAALVDARPVRPFDLARELLHVDGFARPTSDHDMMLRRLFDLINAHSSVRPTRGV
jgi:ABC-type phosphate/phosphonate transport system substrate-binding protein